MLIGILISIILILLAFQDIKMRHINGWLLIPLLLLFFFQSFQAEYATVVFINLGLNVTFLIIQFILVSLFYFIKEKQINFINTKLGIGDILLLFIISASFSFKSFLIFYVGTLLMCIFITIVLERFIRNEKNSIPLVAYISACYLMWYWLSVFLHKKLLYL